MEQWTNVLDSKGSRRPQLASLREGNEAVVYRRKEEDGVSDSRCCARSIAAGKEMSWILRPIGRSGGDFCSASPLSCCQWSRSSCSQRPSRFSTGLLLWDFSHGTHASWARFGPHTLWHPAQRAQAETRHQRELPGLFEWRPATGGPVLRPSHQEQGKEEAATRVGR